MVLSYSRSIEGCTRLEQAGPVTCAHAVAYHQLIYDRILEDVPADIAAMEDWIKIHLAIDQYYAFCISEKKFLVAPVVATQPVILSLESADVIARISEQVGAAAAVGDRRRRAQASPRAASASRPFGSRSSRDIAPLAGGIRSRVPPSAALR